MLVSSEILGLFFNTLTAEEKYSRRILHYFPQQLETQLSQKLKAFFGFVIAFMKCTSSLEHFEEKYKTFRLSIPAIIYSKWRGYLNV